MSAKGTKLVPSRYCSSRPQTFITEVEGNLAQSASRARGFSHQMGLILARLWNAQGRSSFGGSKVLTVMLGRVGVTADAPSFRPCVCVDGQLPHNVWSSKPSLEPGARAAHGFFQSRATTQRVFHRRSERPETRQEARSLQIS